MPKLTSAVLQTMDRIVFTVSWSPKAELATLERLTCNDIPVKLGSPKPEKKGSISVDFAAPKSDGYFFNWSLVFSKPLKSLKAEAVINDSKPVEVGSAEKNEDGRWKEKGDTEK